MDLTALNGILSGSYIFALTFGAVSSINIFYKELDSKQNLALSFIFALIFAFIPADFGNIILNRVKDAVGVAVGLNGTYQFFSGIVKKIGFNSKNIDTV
jgi:hypothetical protein